MSIHDGNGITQSEKYVPDLMMPCLKSDLRSKRSFSLSTFSLPLYSLPREGLDYTSPSFPHFYNGTRPSFSSLRSSNNFTRWF